MACFSLVLPYIVLSLIAHSLADMPHRLYLSDSRSDPDVRTQDGFFCGHHRPRGLHYRKHEVFTGIPYVSASGNRDVAIKYAKTTVLGFQLYYVYHIRTKGLTPGVVQSIAAKYEEKGLTYPYPDEDEYAVTGCVPWKQVKGITCAYPGFLPAYSPKWTLCFS
ncbi:hypothetical protein PpBr36_04209 [Pyricularia pennisetigena]|uniref:hypothetical protein n=1 Tax=Pyricularia pennisetigena TaxID=1578925 RepID=UPI00114ED4D7|nr:hypothetical protein PpBr36_04209 [Pyricularia pennisetigena]TLS26540.1 hypothetical protein PpBr36_04209 [Pyricularia pennisetigena]